MKQLLTTSLIFVLLSLASHAYALPACTDDEPLDGCTASYIWANGFRYDGEFQDGLPHGKGISNHPNGMRYDGEFKNGLPHGKGTNTFSSGASYIGEYKNDKQHGQGTFTSPDGSKYVGEWKGDTMHGQGTLWAEGREISGIWADSEYLYKSAESVDKTELEKYFE